MSPGHDEPLAAGGDAIEARAPNRTDAPAPESNRPSTAIGRRLLACLAAVPQRPLSSAVGAPPSALL
ncbi:Hypothetical protein A7982_04654 [Minicystis rosea]|nr:Hypothetical protein A7982_04654 [Minicystis rosea]